MTTRAERAEAAATLRRVLGAVERGELDVTSAHAKRLLRQIEGATAALEALDSRGRARDAAAQEADDD